MQENINNQNKKQSLFILWGIGLALFWTIFLWNFWTKGILALGFNFTVFLWLLTYIFVYLTKINIFKPPFLSFSLPLILLSTSFALFENPFLKTINLWVLFVFFNLFFTLGFTLNLSSKIWNFNFIIHLLTDRLSFISQIKKAVYLVFNRLTFFKNNTNLTLFKRIALGLFFFSIIALFLILPLLTTADQTFAHKLQIVFEATSKFLAKINFETYFFKTLWFGFFSLFFIAYFLSLKPKDIQNKSVIEKTADPIIFGIILGGIFLIYLVFMYVQAHHLFIKELPFKLQDSKNLVKSGFWQLLFLTGINLIIFFFTYKHQINKILQKILLAFTCSSLLLVFSAGQRMFLYIYYYGLSYEKFFAFYTIFYCIILFIWLLYQLLKKDKPALFKFVFLSLIWMYSLLNLLPIEIIIFKTNFQLRQIENVRDKNNRIRLSEMRELSSDILLLAEKNFKTKKWQKKWGPWIEQKQNQIKNKQWYELNLANLIYRVK